ncbi:zinc finger, CCHC-type containing protein [Tanacetum coccineum]
MKLRINPPLRVVKSPDLAYMYIFRLMKKYTYHSPVEKCTYNSPNLGSRIIHETTAPYTPQQNGVAKRKNRALKEIVNSMLSYSGLSEGFWGEAMLTACYLLNMVSNKRNKTTPYELWFSAKDIIPNSDESQRDDHSNDYQVRLPNLVEVKDLEELNHMVLIFNYIWLADQADHDWNHNTLTAIVLRRILEPIMKLCNLEMLLSEKKQLMMRLINHVEDSTFTSGWVLGGGAISWASKKQTCITGSTMESEFLIALATTGKEAEWLRNLIHEISIWPKPIALM